MCIKRMVLCLIVLCSFCVPAHAGDPFKLSFVVRKGGQWIAPFDNKFTIHSQPTPFAVRLTNVSDSWKEIHKLANAEAIQGLQFEIQAPRSSKKTVKMKKGNLRSNTVISKHIKPGKSRVVRIVMDPEKWENIVIFEPGVEYKVRAVYKSGSTRIYSDYYKVMLEGIDDDW
jgi:hypothetical protein